MQSIFDILKVFSSSAVAFGFAVWMLNIQKKKDRAIDEAEVKKKKEEINRLVTEQFGQLTDELQEERKLLQEKVKALEDRCERERGIFDTERQRWHMERAAMEATINNMRDEIKRLEKKLERQINGVKKTTDELRDRTEHMDKG